MKSKVAEPNVMMPSRRRMGEDMWIKVLMSCVALLGLSGVARAADTALPTRPLAPLYVPSWTGCYVGGHAGYGTATTSSYYSSPVSPVLDVNGFFTANTLVQRFDNKGFAGGGQVGCQQQIGIFLWGFEGDWSSFSNSSSHTFAGGFDEGDGISTFRQNVNESLSYRSLWSVRARFGAVFSEVYHLYATVGVGGARADYVYSASFSETGGDVCLCSSIAGGTSVSPTGLVYGAGAEWKAWSNLVLGVEYLHYMLESDTVLRFDTSSLNPLIALGGHVHTNNVDVVRVRANWLFHFGI